MKNITAVLCCVLLFGFSRALQPRVGVVSGRLLETGCLMRWANAMKVPLMMSEPGGLNEDVLAAAEMLGKPEDSTDKEDKQDIRALVNFYVVAERDNAEGIRSINPSLLLDNGHILTKGRLYEGVMEELLKGDHSGTDIAIIERVDAFLSGFIASERKSRSKMKLNYVIAGASSNRLESAVNLLSETEQIDDDLIMFIDSLIRKKKEPKKAGMGGAMYDDEGLPNPYGTRPSMGNEEEEVGKEEENSKDDSDGDLIGLGEGNDAVAVLQMVRKRLMAEIRTANKPELRLLSMLLTEEEPDTHAEMMRKSFQKVEDMERFETFLINGIEHLSIDDAEVVGQVQVEQEMESSGGNTSGPFQSADACGNADKTKLPADTAARMKDVLLTLQNMMDGTSKNREVFEVKKNEKPLE